VTEKSLTIIEVIKRSEIYLRKKGVDFPKLDSEWITAHALGCSRLDLFLRFEEILTPPQTLLIRDLVIKRGQRIPLQYILEVMDFAGIQLLVDQRALIPRPETEYLVDIISDRLSDDFDGKVADLGTGTGAIILSLAKRFPKLQGYGFEKSPDALELFRINKERCHLKANIECIQFDWEVDTLNGTPYDLIISNPPYLSKSEWKEAEPEVSRYEPFEALVSEQGGYRDIKKIMEIAKNGLKHNGILALEVGIEHPKLVKAGLGNCFDVSVMKDLQNRDRYILAKRI
jgi:release factor glutamine methyltransferase